MAGADKAAICFRSRRAFLVIEPRLGRPLGRGLDRREKPEQGKQRAEHPQRQIERACRQQQCAAAQYFQDRAGLTTLGLRQPCGTRHVFRSLGNSQRIERAARAGLFADASDILGKPDQRARLLGMEGGADGIHGLSRMHHRARCDGILQHRRIHDLARRAAGPFGEPLAQAPDLAGILDQRQSRAHRCRATDRYVGRRRHGKARGGKAQHLSLIHI